MHAAIFSCPAPPTIVLRGYNRGAQSALGLFSSSNPLPPPNSRPPGFFYPFPATLQSGFPLPLWSLATALSMRTVVARRHKKIHREKLASTPWSILCPISSLCDLTKLYVCAKLPHQPGIGPRLPTTPVARRLTPNHQCRDGEAQMCTIVGRRMRSMI